MTLHYTVRPARLDAHIFTVEMSIPGPVTDGEMLCVARWIPGSYLLRNFVRNIVQIRAMADGRSVDLVKADTSSWLLPVSDQALVIQLDVFAHEASVRAAWLDRDRGFFNGTSLFPYVPSRLSDAVTVRIERPTAPHGVDWRVASTLQTVAVDEDGFGDYRAADWDELVDHPVEMGDFDALSFEAGGAAHEMVLAGGCHFDKQRLADDLKTICEQHIGFFEAPAPIDRYLFQTALVESGYGGLEHRASTALMATRDSLPVPGAGPKRSDAYVTFLGLCSHEYFHTWNVKRMKPTCFMPYQLDKESPTRLLWFFEGVTSYYDDLALVRSGIIDHEHYLGLLAKTLTRVQRGAGRHVQSVTDSSLDAWVKFYVQDENTPNAVVSYYAKGALVALCLDAWIREASEGRISLDTLMRGLYLRWLKTGAGLAEDEPEQCVRQLLNDGDAVAERLSCVLTATGDLPLESALAQLGVKLRWRRRTGKSDHGGCGSTQTASATPWLGANTAAADGGLRLVNVLSDGPAERAGLAAADILVAIGGFRVNEGAVDDVLQRHAHMQEVQVHVFRNGRLVVASLPISLPPEDTAELHIDDQSRVTAWLENVSVPA